MWKRKVLALPKARGEGSLNCCDVLDTGVFFLCPVSLALLAGEQYAPKRTEVNATCALAADSLLIAIEHWQVVIMVWEELLAHS